MLTSEIINKKFLITGGAGFIGSHIVEFLLRNNAGLVRVLDNLSTGHFQNIKPFTKYPNFEFINGDLRDLETCRDACKGIEFVNHQAALGSVPRSILEPVPTNEVNVSGFVNIITASKESKVKSFVFASSSSVYGDNPSLPKKEDYIGKALSPYAVSKYTNELYADVYYKLYGIRTIGLRYFNVFGPRQDPNGPYAAVVPLFINSILNNNPAYINGDGEQTRDFTYVENAVQVNINALLSKSEITFGKVYNVAVGENFSINFLYSKVAELLRSNKNPIHREERSGDIRNSLADISRARELLNYIPEVTFLQGLTKTVEYFKTEHELKTNPI